MHQVTYDVIIIGAGFAGLTAAYYLKEKDSQMNILIVEAKSRVGGKVESVELKVNKYGNKANFDIGGQWITDSQKNIGKLLKRFNVNSYKQFDTGKKILESNKRLIHYTDNNLNISTLSKIDLNTIKTKFNIASDRINTTYPFENYNLATHLDEISLSQYLYSNSISTNAKIIIENAVRSIYGLESTSINALFALMCGKSGSSITKQNLNREKKIVDGAQGLCHMMSEHILNLRPSKIMLNTELIEINQERGSSCMVTVRNALTGVKEKFSCKKLVSCIPFNQYAYIKCLPSLPAYKTNLFKFMQSGNMNSFLITYEKAFWRDKGLSGSVISDGSQIENVDFFRFLNRKSPKVSPITCLFDATTHMGHPAIGGFSGGKAALEWLDQDVDTRKNEIIESLQRYFGKEASEYCDYYEKNWSNEFNLSVISFGCMDEFTRAVREPWLNVHFGGAESAKQWWGTIDGACESGERCALEIVHSVYDDLTQSDFEKTFYFQQKNIENILDINEKSSFKLNFSLMSKYFLLFFLISIALYILFSVFFYV